MNFGKLFQHTRKNTFKGKWCTVWKWLGLLARCGRPSAVPCPEKAVKLEDVFLGTNPGGFWPGPCDLCLHNFQNWRTVTKNRKWNRVEQCYKISNVPLDRISKFAWAFNWISILIEKIFSTRWEGLPVPPVVAAPRRIRCPEPVHKRSTPRGIPKLR